jgi:Xaa-Pro aminopeptidase
VLAAQRAVFEIARPGVLWSECHLAAEREIIRALVTLGVLVGDVQAIQDAGVGAVFLPHGLGHLIGCDTHDVGGYDYDYIFFLKVGFVCDKILLKGTSKVLRVDTPDLACRSSELQEY